MTIRTKLTLNVFLVVIVITAVALTGFLGMGFIKGKLSHPTEKSTPFQLRTVEFQRAVQAATSDFLKTSTSDNRKEFTSFKAEAEKSIQVARTSQKSLENMTGETQSTCDDLEKIFNELITVTDQRITAEEEAATAASLNSQRLLETSRRLRELDRQIKILQVNSSKTLEQASLEKVVAHIHQTLADIDEIVVYVGKVTNMVQQTSIAVKEQSATSEEINRNIVAMEVSREVTACFNDIKSSAGSLAHLASDFKTTVSWFKI